MNTYKYIALGLMSLSMGALPLHGAGVGKALGSMVSAGAIGAIAGFHLGGTALALDTYYRSNDQSGSAVWPLSYLWGGLYGGASGGILGSLYGLYRSQNPHIGLMGRCLEGAVVGSLVSIAAPVAISVVTGLAYGAYMRLMHPNKSLVGGNQPMDKAVEIGCRSVPLALLGGCFVGAYMNGWKTKLVHRIGNCLR